MLFETNVLLATCTVHPFIVAICRKQLCTEHWHFCMVRIFIIDCSSRSLWFTCSEYVHM